MRFEICRRNLLLLQAVQAVAAAVFRESPKLYRRRVGFCDLGNCFGELGRLRLFFRARESELMHIWV